MTTDAVQVRVRSRRVEPPARRATWRTWAGFLAVGFWAGFLIVAVAATGSLAHDNSPVKGQAMGFGAKERLDPETPQPPSADKAFVRMLRRTGNLKEARRVAIRYRASRLGATP